LARKDPDYRLDQLPLLSRLSTVRKLFRRSVNAGNQLENCSAHHPEISEGNKVMRISGEIILEKVRRYRATASLYRQTAAFRPLQKWSLLEQAERWDRLAVAELEDYFNFNSPDYDEELHVTPYANARCEMAAAAWVLSCKRRKNLRRCRLMVCHNKFSEMPAPII
jgi:hypothetical protein